MSNLILFIIMDFKKMKQQKFNVINFHLTEKCNYQCVYCFSKFKNSNELNLDDWKKMVDLVDEYFQRNDINDGRISLAGGEPLLVKFLDELINYIYAKNIKISIITNCSLLTKSKIDSWANKIEFLGVSIDSINKEKNLINGRNSNGKTIELDKLIDILNYAKEKGMKLKVNTVVSKINLYEDIMPLYHLVEFDRIKLLQVRINQNCNEEAKKYEITSDEFDKYCAKVITCNKKIIIEKEQDIESSYIVIGPKGHLFSNRNKYFQKIGTIFNEKLESLITKAELNYQTFLKRYI